MTTIKNDIDQSDIGTPETYTPDTLILEDVISPRTTARQRGDFARLVPKNRAAKVAFSAIVDMLKMNAEWNPHARQFMFFDEAQSEIQAWRGSDTDETLESDLRIWTGYYRLNLNLLPQNPPVGWILGGGRKELPNHGVDFMLTLEKSKDQIHGIHARLTHHSESLAFMVFVGPRKTVSVNGKDISNTQRQIIATNTSLELGLLQYQLEFTLLEETRYREQLCMLRQRFSLGTDLATSLEITPSESHHEFQGFTIQAPIAFGSYGIVSPGTEIATGRAVVVKRLRRTKGSIDRIQLEVSIYKAIGRHNNLSQIMADMYSGGNAFTTGKSPVDDVYLIHYPLAKETFFELAVSDRPYWSRSLALRQVLQGLAHLHNHNIMHRDIKPTNLMIVSYEPLHAIIIDFGDATFEAQSINHYRGTIAYLAPEVLALKSTGSGDPYDNRVDIWALGICAYQLFFKAQCEWRDGMQEEVHKKIIEVVRRATGISSIIRDMIAWERSGRSSAQDLLLHSVWATTRDSPQSSR